MLHTLEHILDDYLKNKSPEKLNKILKYMLRNRVTLENISIVSIKEKLEKTLKD